jgi:hypothetical protein
MADTVMLVVLDAECAHARELAGRLSANVVVHETGPVKGAGEVRRAAAGIAEAALRQAADLIVVACSEATRSSGLAGELMASGPCPVVMVPADSTPAVRAA